VGSGRAVRGSRACDGSGGGAAIDGEEVQEGLAVFGAGAEEDGARGDLVVGEHEFPDAIEQRIGGDGCGVGLDFKVVLGDGGVLGGGGDNLGGGMVGAGNANSQCGECRGNQGGNGGHN
jgi:hypothetical protein